MPNQTHDAGGWVDTHLHLLPGLDDGPADMDQSLAMAEAAIADGMVRAIATPHANYQYNFDPEKVRALRLALQQRLGDRLEVQTGCELHLSYENVQRALEQPKLYTLNQGRYLLVEFPEFFERHALSTALEQFLDAGLVPVIAHPERNPVFQQHPEALDDYLRLGCLSQVTASSFRGRFGKRAEQFSLELLNTERIHVVASDGHSAAQRPPFFAKAFAYIQAKASDEIALALCRDNPRAICDNRELPYLPSLPAAKRKGLWALLRG